MIYGDYMGTVSQLKGNCMAKYMMEEKGRCV